MTFSGTHKISLEVEKLRLNLCFERDSQQHASEPREHIRTKSLGKYIRIVFSCGYVEEFDDLLGKRTDAQNDGGCRCA